MHSNNTQVHVQLPATYYPLGPVAMTGSMSFSSSNHHSIDHGAGTNNGNTSMYQYHSGSPLHSHSSHHAAQSQLGSHGHQLQHSHNHSYAHHTDLQKPIPIQHQVDIYQTPHPSL